MPTLIAQNVLRLGLLLLACIIVPALGTSAIVIVIEVRAQQTQKYNLPAAAAVSALEFGDSFAELPWSSLALQSVQQESEQTAPHPLNARVRV